MYTCSLETTSLLMTATWWLWHPVGTMTKTALASTSEATRAMVDMAEDRLGDHLSADAGRGKPTGPPHSGGDETRNRDYSGHRWEERCKPLEQTINPLDELPEYCTEDEKAAQLFTLVEVAHTSMADAQLPISLLIQVAEVLEEVRIPPKKLHQLAGLQSEADPDSDIFHNLLQAGLSEVARN